MYSKIICHVTKYHQYVIKSGPDLLMLACHEYFRPRQILVRGLLYILSFFCPPGQPILGHFVPRTSYPRIYFPPPPDIIS